MGQLHFKAGALKTEDIAVELIIFGCNGMAMPSWHMAELFLVMPLGWKHCRARDGIYVTVCHHVESVPQERLYGVFNMNELLSEKQLKALQVLSKKGTFKEAAQAAKCGIRTVFRWAKIPEFQARLRGFSQARMEAVEEVIRQQESVQVQDLVPLSLERIQQILKDPNSRNVDAIKAAELIGKWAQLDQLQKKEEISPEDTLKSYLNQLATIDNQENNLP